MRKIKGIMFLLVAVFLFGVTNVSAATNVTDESSLKQALADGETVINLDNDIVLSNDVGTSSTRTVGLEVKGEGTITINGNGHEISSSLVVAMEVRANSGKEVKVVLNDITVIGAERAIDIRSAKVTLELNKTNLSVTKVGNYQALTVGGSAGPITVDINDNSVIDGGKYGYGIITFNPVTLTIDDSTVKGYGALYMREANGSEGSAGSVVTISNSTIEGNSSSSGSTDNFAAIVLSDKNITINVVDSVIKATNTGTAYQTPFMLGEEIQDFDEDEKIVINVEGKSEIVVDLADKAKEALVVNYDKDKIDVVVKSGVSSNLKIEKEYLEEGAETVVDEKTGVVSVVKKYNVTLDKVTNGTVTVEKEKALAGDVIEITANPNKDYKLEKIVVLDAAGKQVEVSNNKFTMPESDVTVSVTFASSIANPNTYDSFGLYALIGFVSLFGLIGASVYFKKCNS